MFMRVKSKCAHQVRPPLDRATGCSAVVQLSRGCRAIRLACGLLLVSERRIRAGLLTSSRTYFCCRTLTAVVFRGRERRLAGLAGF